MGPLRREIKRAAIDGRCGGDHERAVGAAGDSLDRAAAELRGQDRLGGGRGRVLRVEILVGGAGPTGNLLRAAGLNDRALVDPVGEGVQRARRRTIIGPRGALCLSAEGLVRLDLPLKRVEAALVGGGTGRCAAGLAGRWLRKSLGGGAVAAVTAGAGAVREARP